MTTFRASIAKWALPITGLFLVVFGIGLIFSISVPPLLLGILALIAGIACLLAS